MERVRVTWPYGDTQRRVERREEEGRVDEPRRKESQLGHWREGRVEEREREQMKNIDMREKRKVRGEEPDEAHVEKRRETGLKVVAEGNRGPG